MAIAMEVGPQLMYVVRRSPSTGFLVVRLAGSGLIQSGVIAHPGEFNRAQLNAIKVGYVLIVTVRILTVSGPHFLDLC